MSIHTLFEKATLAVQSYDSYCQIIITPKIKKLFVQYGQVVKDEYQEKNP